METPQHHNNKTPQSISSSSDLPDLSQASFPEPTSAQAGDAWKHLLSAVGGFAAGVSLVGNAWALSPFLPSHGSAVVPHRDAGLNELVGPERANPVSLEVPRDQVNVADVIARVAPSIVQIDVRKRIESPIPGGPTRMGQSLGSGFIVDPSGIIVTNHHVVQGGEEFGVTLSSGERVIARVIGTDPASDIAVLRVNTGKPLPALTLGSSDGLRQGEWVLAYGDPLGLNDTVTMGIVSALGRSGTQIGLENVLGLIQTDAAINPGNSGGPLLNMRGEVIGINDAMIEGAGGIGFAIPITGAKRIINELIQHGRAVHSAIGVEAISLSHEVLQELQGIAGWGDKVARLRPGRGALVLEVLSGSPAERCGIRPGDVIVKVGDTAVSNDGTLRRIVDGLPVGTAIPLTVVRDGQQRTITVESYERPDVRELKLAEHPNGSAIG